MRPVYVSPSAQEHNIGYGTFGSEEQRMNQVADVVCALLTYNSIPWARNKPEMTLTQIVADSNAKNPSLHCAIHSNAGGGRGTVVFYSQGSVQGKSFAENVYGFLAPASPGADRGVVANTTFAELNKTKAPAMLAEVSFHDNPEDALWIINNIPAIGEAIARGIAKTLNVPFKMPEPPKPAEQGRVYKVQVGAFSVRENAEKMVKDLENKGYKPIIV